MEFHEECLKAHNELRCLHNSGNLVLNGELCSYSQKLADYLVSKHEFGENTYALVSTPEKRQLQLGEAIECWYREVENYNFDEEPSSLTSGRFTQMVWKETEFLGVGFARENGRFVLVANYYPPGNIKGEFLKNVSEPFDPNSTPEGLFEELPEEENIDVQKVVDQCLNIHNLLRAKHSAPPLKVKKSLCEKSQMFAEYLIKKCDYGENTYCIISTDPDRRITGDEPVKSWHNEGDRYDFTQEAHSPSTRHFSQLIWRDSKELGVGVAVNGKRTVVVANYHPPGNVPGEYSFNVLPTLGSPVRSLEDETSNLFITRKDSKKGIHGDFKRDFLNAHNEYRQRHGVGPLEYHASLNIFSQQWADFLAAKDVLEPRDNCPFGENLYSVSCSTEDFTIDGRKPVDFWYDEIKHGDTKQMENYAQVVSKVSQYLGVGVSKSKQGNIYVVANYSSEKNMTQKAQCFIDSEKRIFWNDNSVNEDGYTAAALEGLGLHNKYRELHGVPSLHLNKDLCGYAQEWANNLAKLNVVQYRPQNKYGENIFELKLAQNLTSPIEKAVTSWYNELKLYDFTKAGWKVQTENFTQMIWKDTQEIGIAVAVNKYGYVYVVANYSPKGNVGTGFEKNVLPPKHAEN